MVGAIQSDIAGVLGDPRDLPPAVPVEAVLALDHQRDLDHSRPLLLLVSCRYSEWFKELGRSATLGRTCSGGSTLSAAEAATPVSTSSASIPAAWAPATSASGLSPAYRHASGDSPTLCAASHNSVMDGLPTTTSGGRPTARSSAAAKT